MANIDDVTPHLLAQETGEDGEEHHEGIQLETLEQDRKTGDTSGDSTDDALDNDVEKKEHKRHRRRKRREGEEEGEVGERSHHHRKKNKHRSKTRDEGTELKQPTLNGVEKSLTNEQQQLQQNPLPPQYHEVNQYSTQTNEKQPLHQPPPQQMGPYAVPQQQGEVYPKQQYSYDPSQPYPITITQQPQLQTDDFQSFQFGGPQYPQQAVIVRGPPQNYMALSWLVCLFCCWPIGIFAIISSSQVNTLYANGKYEEAENVSRRAKSLVIAGFIVGIVLVVCIFVLRLMLAAGA